MKISLLRQGWQSLILPSDKSLLLRSAPALDFLLPRNCLIDVLKVRKIHESHGSSAMCVARRIKIFAMFREPAFIVIGDSRVVAAIGTMQDVDEVLVHRRNILSRGAVLSEEQPSGPKSTGFEHGTFCYNPCTEACRSGRSGLS